MIGAISTPVGRRVQERQRNAATNKRGIGTGYSKQKGACSRQRNLKAKTNSLLSAGGVGGGGWPGGGGGGGLELGGRGGGGGVGCVGGGGWGWGGGGEGGGRREGGERGRTLLYIGEEYQPHAP